MGCHSEAGNGKRDGLKNSHIGQSAALCAIVQTRKTFAVELTHPEISWREMDAKWLCDDLLEAEADFCLFSLPAQIRKDLSEKIFGRPVMVVKAIGEFSLGEFIPSVDVEPFDGWDFPGCTPNEFHRPFITHQDGNDDTVTLPPCAGEPTGTADVYRPFTVNNTGGVGCGSWIEFVREGLSCEHTFIITQKRSTTISKESRAKRPEAHSTRKGDEMVLSVAKVTAAGDGGIGNSEPMRKQMAYTNDDYVGIAWPTTLRSLKNTLETIHQYTVPGIQLIFNGEIGRYENTRFVEQTNIVKGISTDGASGTAWASGNDWIFFMGEDTVAEGVAIPEEMRAKIPTDFGRSKGVAWYYLGGFGIVQTAASESRIVVWDSAV